MDNHKIHAKVTELLETISSQNENMQEGSVSKIELDIMLAKVRELYEWMSALRAVQETGTENTHFEKPIVPQVVEPVMQTAMPAAETSATSSIQPSQPVISTLFGDEPAQVKTKSKPSVSERGAGKTEDKSIAGRLQRKPVTDLKAAIGINEKFIFVNELFNGNTEEYHQALESINKLNSFLEADEYIQNNLVKKYNWNAEAAPVASFIDLIERRFL